MSNAFKDSGNTTRPGIELLGRRLATSVELVVTDSRHRTSASGHPLGEDVEEIFLTAVRTSTEAFSLWMTSGNPDIARREGLKATKVFGELAARQDVPLNEVTKRCLRWHDAVASTLHEIAGQLGVEDSLPEVLAMLDRSLQVTIVRMTESFEKERLRTQESLTLQQERIAFQASHDSLTGLPNRTLIMDRIGQLLVRHRRFGTEATVIFLDLDNFKVVNDNLGHRVGDHLLQAVGERLIAQLRESDTLGRLGGDEFIVVADCIPPSEAPELICQRLLAAFIEPFEVHEPGCSAIHITASIGTATGEDLSAEEILKRADLAMYRAKRDGKNCFVRFQGEMLTSAARSFEMDGDLQRAVHEEEFSLLYQPVVDVASMSVIGVEALIRWRHPSRGLLGPEEFIPYLEESGLITSVGRWVLQEATTQAARWRRGGLNLEMAVNLSRRELDQERIVEEIATALGRSGLDPHDLCVEVTETAVMSNFELAQSRLRAIRSLGVRIAVDDFGTGYSSLSHLQQFPVDLLKIDQSFIRRLFLDRSAAKLIRAQIQMAKAMEMTTQAEGVEDDAQLEYLREEGCVRAQGFHIARPLSVPALEKFIEGWAGVPLG